MHTLSFDKQQIYAAAVEQLTALQTEMGQEKVAARRQQRRVQGLVVGGMLLTSLLSALSTYYCLPGGNRPLSGVETEAIRNLIDYVAVKYSNNNAWVSQALVAHFKITAIEELKATNYDEAVSYLLKLTQRS